MKGKISLDSQGRAAYQLAMKFCFAKGRFSVFVLVWMGLGIFAHLGAQEVEMDLNSLTAPASPTQESVNFKLLGRVDLHGDFYTSGREGDETQESELDARHLFLFLKIRASEKTQVFGEFVQRSFVEVERSLSLSQKLKFGKIRVPFGRQEGFHHWYGGRNEMNGQGTFLPVIFAEPGLSWTWEQRGQALDLYWVNGFTLGIDGKPALNQSGSGEKQMLGFRWTRDFVNELQMNLSYLYSEPGLGQTVNLPGLDFFWSRWPWWSFSFGRAVAFIEDPEGPDSFKAADYLVQQFRLPASLLGRLRYGTVTNDSENESQSNTHHWNLSFQKRWEELSGTIEHQWNFEEVDEINNDFVRLVLALDF